MVIREDLPFQDLPTECCANCGFLMQSKSDYAGGNQRDEPVKLHERWRGLEYLDETLFFSGNRKIAGIKCWMRRDFPGDEARVGLSGDAEAKRLNLEAMHRDRGEDSDAHCPQFFPWNPRRDYEQHSEERRVYLLERHRREWEASQAEMRQEWAKEQERERQKRAEQQEDSRRRYESEWKRQWLPLGIATISIIASAVIGIYAATIEADATREAASPPVAVSPQSTPDTSAGQP